MKIVVHGIFIRLKQYVCMEAHYLNGIIGICGFRPRWNFPGGALFHGVKILALLPSLILMWILRRFCI
jgi:hypothetical protein